MAEIQVDVLRNALRKNAEMMDVGAPAAPVMKASSVKGVRALWSVRLLAMASPVMMAVGESAFSVMMGMPVRRKAPVTPMAIVWSVRHWNAMTGRRVPRTVAIPIPGVFTPPLRVFVAMKTPARTISAGWIAPLPADVPG